MKFATTLILAAFTVALVSTVPVPDNQSLRSQVLERLVMVEGDNEEALRSKRTIGILRQLFPQLSETANQEAEDRLAEETAESQNNEVRVQFADEQANEAGGSELAPLEDVEVSDDENRNKRFLNFGFGASGGAGGAGAGGSGGGSGNFLFDIIRQAADGAARAAGTVYRVVAGTQSLGLGLSASRDVAPAPAPAAPAPSAPAANAGVAPAPAAAPAPGAGTQPPLVAGSGSSQQGDVAAGAPSPGRNDGTTEAVPGPVTRLFVIANRGISNLIQDLILRLAATSERIVNFKARLITSII
ncbi:brain acid soluble protein 1 isoform X3 [Venturia canescens]|uniref:brain acid soluble protein 1 isoform X3 n=1 Tax=Venturia canescens TaxID=32260 RepID=UPI001C9CC6BF|nr:brain acid soluble protein 1 isoform X3 [Venturia canescens]